MGFLKSTQGLRQGDHLSPLLFVFVTEAFSKIISGVVKGRFFIQILNGGGKYWFTSHLSTTFFLISDLSPIICRYPTKDDTLIFCGTYCDRIHTLRALHICFKAVSKLKVDLAKSKIVPRRNVLYVESMANILEY